MRDPQAWSGHHTELLRCHDAAVAGDDSVVSVDQDRVDPAELTQAAAELGNLRGAVGAGVAGIGDQLGERDLLDGFLAFVGFLAGFLRHRLPPLLAAILANSSESA